MMARIICSCRVALPFNLLIFISCAIIGARGFHSAFVPMGQIHRSTRPTNTIRDSGMHNRRQENYGSLFNKLRIDDDLVAEAEEEDPSTSSSSSLKDILTLVAPLLLIYISNQWSRYSISYLVDFSSTSDATTAMNVDLNFNQSQYGLLASAAFTVLFAFSSLVAGNLADKYNRKLLTLASCGVWALATLATSQAHSYNEVLILRIIMGGACAFAIPAGYSLIADNVSKDKLASSNSIYSSGVYLGGALSSISLLLDESIGWRGTLALIGGFGVVSAAAAGLLLPSDDRDTNTEPEEIGLTDNTQQNNSAEDNSLLQNTLQILSIPRVQFIFLASFLRFCSGLMIAVWAAPYYKQAFPDNASEYAVVNAFIVGAMGMTSGIAGGAIADKLGAWFKETKADISDMNPVAGALSVYENFDEQTIRLLLPIIGSLLAIPAWYLTTQVDSFEIAMFWLAVEYLVAECWFGPTIAVLQSTVGASKTGTAQGLFVLTGALANSAPTLLGWIYGNQIAGQSSSSSSEALANLLAVGVCATYFLSSVFFAVSVGASGESSMDAAKQKQ